MNTDALRSAGAAKERVLAVLSEEASVYRLLRCSELREDAGLRCGPGDDEGVAYTGRRARDACLEQA